MGSGGVLDSDGKQFVVAEVQSQTGATANVTGDPAYDAFELVADEKTYSPTKTAKRTSGGNTTSLAGRGRYR